MEIDEFESIVDATIARLPDWAREAMQNIAVVVCDDADPELIPEAEDELLGFYAGVPLHERGTDYAGELPDVIYIFRNPHLSLGLPPDELKNEIVTTVVHEIAHYFGIDDDHLHEIGWG